MRNLVSMTALGIVVLGFSTLNAFANAEEVKSRWTEMHAKYESTDPMKMTCNDFNGTKSVYREHAVSYLAGRHDEGLHGKGHASTDYQPVSVPHMMKVCEGDPKAFLHDAIGNERMK